MTESAILERVLSDSLPGWKLQPVVIWIIAEGRLISDPVRLIEGFVQVLRTAGAPVDRLMVGISTLHPQLVAWSVYWDVKEDRVKYIRRERGVMISGSYDGSPLQTVREHGTILRRRLQDIGSNDHATYHELVADRMTDYLAVPLIFSDGRRNFVSFATSSPIGFTDDDLAKLATLPLFFGPIVEAIEQRNVALTLLKTYVGGQTGHQILQGLIKRGDGETIRAALWYSDLRNFTMINEQLPPHEVLAMLNSYFEFVAAAVTARGGEILQFIGDAILVIFRVPDDGDDRVACNAALDSAVDALDSLAVLNSRRVRAGQMAIRFGVGLHVGVVTHGNVGSLDRLGFNVVGPAVNRTARIEALTKLVGVALLMSSEVAAHSDRPVESRGAHLMKGVAEPQEVFALVDSPEDTTGSATAGGNGGRRQ
jgi:adenylate cyclase